MIALPTLRWIKWVGLSLTLLHSALMARQAPDSLILSYQYFVDWVRADVGNHFKKKDTILMPNSLIKIDLSTLPPGMKIERASLHLYIQQTYQPVFFQIIRLYAVNDNAWDSDKTVTEDIYLWPTSEILDSSVAGQTGWKVFNITTAAKKARQQDAGILSLKWGIAPNLTPLAWDIATSPSWDLAGKLDRYDNSNRRPFVKIVYTDTTKLPDLHIGSSDVQLKPRLAHPGETVTISAKIHNFGGKKAGPVVVRFFDMLGHLIGSDRVIGALPAFNGVDSVGVPWTVAIGTQHVRVEVDPDGQIAEMRETNNTVLRSFVISPNYKIYADEFEGSTFNWTADFDLPVDQNALGDQPMQWLILPQEGIRYFGLNSILMFLDGRRDDGAIWIERAFPVEPFSHIKISLDFFVRDPFVRIQPWEIVAFVGTYNPEDEVIFEPCTDTPPINFWKQCAFTKTIFTGPASEVWVAMGIWARWEVTATFYLDRVSVKIDPSFVTTDQKTAGSSDLPRNWSLLQNHPNPFAEGTRIACYFPEAGLGSLRLFDVLGREVRRFDHRAAAPGYVEFFWNGRSETGEALPNGVYFYAIGDGHSLVQRRKMIKIK